jgi:pyoverdine/dityrosine biosynthesis protein Dit1
MSENISILANPYVYPSKDYNDLNDCEIRWTVNDESISSLQEVSAILSPLVVFKDSPNSLQNEAGVFDLFCNEKVCFGISPKNQKTPWIERFQKSNARGHYAFSLFGFPFKMPVPLKTERTLPDAGELASLLRLNSILQKITDLTACKATLTIFAEEGFGKFIGLPDGEPESYYQFLLTLLEKSGLSKNIRAVRMSDMEKHPRFKSHFENNLQENLTLFKANNNEYLKKYQGARLSVFRLLDTRRYPHDLLAQVYSYKEDQEIEKSALEVRNHLREKEPVAIASYFAYLKARDDISFIESIVPNGLPLSVSPKEGRLGIYPIHQAITVLPYHGIPILWKDNRFSIEYIYDTKRMKKHFEKVRIQEDQDLREPFLYREL